VFLHYAPSFAHEKASTGRRSKLHMHIIMPKCRLPVIGPNPFLSQTGQACYGFSG